MTLHHLLSVSAALSLSLSAASTYYIDADNGKDTNDGRSPQTAWQTLFRSTLSILAPGDTVLLKRGCLWRETLHPRSGSPGRPIRYSAYGEGPLPIIQTSIDASDPAIWTSDTPGIWHTPKFKNFTYDMVREIPVDHNARRWYCHADHSRNARVDLQITTTADGTPAYTLKCLEPGQSQNDIQFWCQPVAPYEDAIVLRFRARANRAVDINNVRLLTEGPVYTTVAQGLLSAQLSPEWQDLEILFPPHPGPFPQKTFLLHFYLGGKVKPGDVIELQPASTARQVRLKESFKLFSDIGNIIFDHGKQCGWKKWNVSQLANPYDYVYSIPEHCVYLRHDGNPAQKWSSIELVRKAHGVSQGGCHDIIYENLAVRYVGSHGFGGGNTRNLVIRNCDISYIGGAHQFDGPKGNHVRYGNGIEFWGNCDHNLVENCRIWEIYDAALTNQGANDTETHITYRNNLIWNAEFSFEYWNRKTTDDIQFVHNTCLNAGGGWAHAQRPDANGAHLMFYSNRAKTTNFSVRDNIFIGTTEQGMRMDINWLGTISLDHNLWLLPPDKPVYRVRLTPQDKKFTYIMAADLTKPDTPYGTDRHSLFTAPDLLDAGTLDVRPAPGSPAASASSDGKPLGRLNP